MSCRRHSNVAGWPDLRPGMKMSIRYLVMCLFPDAPLASMWVRQINQAMSDNSMAVTRAMSGWPSCPGERESRTEQTMTGFENGSFLLNRLGAGGVIDQDLAAVLLNLRRGLIDD
jgi:hypothetical protein